MIWSSVHDFLRMGGYGLYVWGSFGVTALLMAVEVLWTRQQRRALRQEMRQQPGDGLLEDWQS
jgi:heme exporter protein D